VIGQEDHHEGRAADGLGGGLDCESGFGRFVPVGAAGRLRHLDLDARVAKVLRVRVALAAVADNGDFPGEE